MHKLLLIVFVLMITACNPKLANGLRKNVLTKDVELVTSKGVIIVRLSDSTPLHRDNFIKLVKQHYYDSMLFHRVINQYLVQTGDPNSKNAKPGQQLGYGGPNYIIPAEFRAGLFPKRGVILAASTSPAQASHGSQFCLVQGKVYTDDQLDSIEQKRLRGYKLPEAHRQVYKTLGGAAHLDQLYTVFGEIIKGLPVVDSIAAVMTDKSDRPVEDVRIIKATLVKRQAAQQMGKKKELTTEEIADAKEESVFPQLNYNNGHYKLEIKGIANIEGKESYKLAVTNPSGIARIEYYDVATGYLVKKETAATREGQDIRQVTGYGNYRKTGDLSIAATISNTIQMAAGAQEYTIEFSDIKLNEKFSAVDFE